MNELLLRRRVAKGLSYAEIEYIGGAGNGKAYINTGYVPQGLDIRIACKFYYGGYHRKINYPGLVHAYVGDSTRCYRLMMRAQTNNLVVQNARRGNLSTDNSYLMSVGNVYEVDFNHFNYTINGTTYTHTNYGTSTENTDSLKFLDVSNSLNLRFYYFKVWKGDNMIFDMIPVRIGNEGYFYDKISGNFFGNAGTGSFILGPDV